MRKLANHIPNAITLLNLLAGCISIALASEGNYAGAAGFIFIASLLDFLDGLVARLLKAYSGIGAQLDSLADMISFGFAPSFLLFKYLLPFHGTLPFMSLRVGAAIIAFLPFMLAVFSALRLAKFNLDTRQKNYFMGLPTPAMAIFFASSIFLCQGSTFITEFSLIREPLLWHGLAILFSVLMISEIKMFSVKFQDIKWVNNQFQYLFVGISVILLVSLQAVSVPLIIIWYIVLSFFYHIFKAKTDSL